MESTKKSDRKFILRDAVVFETRFGCTQGWFVRARWEKKLHFIFTLIKMYKGVNFIRFIISICKSRTKDVVYAENSKSSTFDIVPHDDDRELDPVLLDYMMEQDLIWFAGMKSDEQTDFLAGLIHIGGPALARRVLQEIEAKLATSEKANEQLNDALNRTSAVLGTNISSKFVRRKHRRNKIKDEISGRTHSQLQNEESDETRNIPYGEEEEEEETVYGFRNDVNSDILNSPEVQQAKQQWMEEMERVQTELDNWNPFGKYTEGGKSTTSINVDNMQNLPLWVTRKFAQMLPPETQKEMKKINSFWAYTIDELQKEQSAQQGIEKQVRKLEAKLQSPQHNTVKLPGKPTEKKLVPCIKKSVTGEENDILEEIRVKPRTRTIKKLLGASNVEHAHTYHDQFCTIDVSQNFHSARIVACCSKTSLVAVTTPKLTITFHSILTGVQLSPSLEGHTGVITCLCFHCDGDKIFSGSSDLTIRCWHIWTQSTLNIYEGHEESVTCMSVNENYLISGSADKTIRVFNIHSAQNIVTFTDENLILCVGIDKDHQGIITGSDEGEIKVYRIYNNKRSPIIIKGHCGRILTMQVSTPIVLTGGTDGFVKAWNIKKMEKCLVSLNHDSPVYAVTLSHHQVLSGGQSGHLKIWCIFQGTLLQSIIITPELCPIMQLLTTNAEENPSNVIIATDSFIKIIDFYKKKVRSFHIHHTKCFQDPTKTTLFHAPACMWAIPTATTELLKNHDKLPKHCFTIKESHHHRRLRNIMARQCTVKKMRNNAPQNTLQSVLIDALSSVPVYEQLQYAIVSYPRNKSNFECKIHSRKK